MGGASSAGAKAESVRNGITFDTGALIALERRSQRARSIVERAAETKVRITVPAAVITEWWRARTDIRAAILAAVSVEALDAAIAKAAGEAVAMVRGATAIDAIVMASAARRGDTVYTSDIDDLQALAGHFRSVRVLAV